MKDLLQSPANSATLEESLCVVSEGFFTSANSSDSQLRVRQGRSRSLNSFRSPGDASVLFLRTLEACVAFKRLRGKGSRACLEGKNTVSGRCMMLQETAGTAGRAPPAP